MIAATICIRSGDSRVAQLSRRAEVAWALLGAVVVRVIAAGFEPSLSQDAAVYYLPNARALVEGGLGNWDGMTSAVPPLFPTLVALLSPLIPDLELAALTLSVVAGALLILPSAALATVFFPEQPLVRRLTCLFAVVQPLMVRFSGDAKADSLYALCFVTAFWLAVRILQTPRARLGAAFGGALGAAYLMRPESLGLALLIAAGTVVMAIAHRRAGRPVAAYSRGVLIAGTLAVVTLTPCLAWNMFFVHHKIGVWSLSPKAGVLHDYGKVGGGDPLRLLNHDLTRTVHEERLSSADKFESFSLARVVLDDPQNFALSFADNFWHFARYVPDVMGAALFLLFMVGVCAPSAVLAGHGIGSVAGARRTLWTTLLFYACAFSIFYVARRFWVPLVPLLLPWSAAGLLLLRSTRWGGRSTLPRWTALVLLLTLLQVCHHLDWFRYGWRPAPEPILAARLQSKLAADESILSDKGRVSWYVGAKHLPIPTATAEETLRFLENRKCRWVVVDERSAKRRRPELWQLLQDRERFQLADEEQGAGRTLLLYRRS